MEKEHCKKFFVLSIVGAGIALLMIILALALGLSGVIGGLKEGFGAYLAIFSTTSPVNFISLFLVLFAIVLLIVNVIFIVLKKKMALLLNALCLFIAMAFMPIFLLAASQQLEASSLSVVSAYLLVLLLLLDVASIIILAKPLHCLYKPHKPCHQEVCEKQEAPAEEKEEPVEEVKEEEPAPQPEPVKEEPKEEKVVEEEKPAPQPVKKENKVVSAPVEVNEEEDDSNPFGRDEIIQEGEIVNEEEYEIVEVIDENGQKVRVKRRRKASFETRLKGSEFDLRHKYYDLRDYLKWYGLSNRVSLPGDTFSYKRKKLAFITIIGKRIKFYIALDPAKYEDSPIPIERATAKKYADTPCSMKVKSDLSYRRAKKLIDEAMAEAGIARPEGEEPKETQHPEQE